VADISDRQLSAEIHFSLAGASPLKRAIVALTAHKARQAKERRAAGDAWHDNDLVFCHENGAPYTSDQLNWRFGKMTRRAGIGRWHAHEGRHTAVSIMSNNDVPIQEISDTVGHKSTHVTETVYRHVIVPAEADPSPPPGNGALALSDAKPLLQAQNESRREHPALTPQSTGDNFVLCCTYEK
jgi:hypothetical protein